ncbi:MAG: outer membrane protein assembly factor BamA [Treponema sp.]|nr:outer membrane protein assembly factor BamA [Treponema sp.]
MRFRVLVFLLLAASVSVFSQGYDDDEWYQAKPIREITFTGLKNVLQSELSVLMNPYRHRNFDYDIFWEIQGKLYALEYFDRIDPSISPHPSGDVIISFAVIERPIINRIIFNGNSGIRRNDLLDTITTKVSDVFNQAKVRVDVEAIKNKYIESGYPNVAVESAETINGDNVTLTFTITEGDKITIRRIEFQSTNKDVPLKFSNNMLRNQLSLKAKSLLNDGAFQEAKLLIDIEAITKYYHDRGYIDAKVIDVPRSLEDDEKGGANLILTFLIEEGEIFTFGGVSFDGNLIFSTEQLAKLINSKTGETVNYSRVEADLQRVSDLYYENGYIFNSIARIPDKNNSTHVLSYTIQIIERSRAYIENIVIRGNDKTKTEVILREIPLEPGDVFSRTKVIDAMRNLYNLQFFSLVIPEPTQGSAENLMDLVFTVEEQPTTDIQFGVTFSGSADPDTFPISGLVKWNDRNLAGTGNQLGIELSSSIRDTTSASVSYLHRWLFGLPFSGGFDFSVNYQKRQAAMDNRNPIFNGDEPYAFPDGFNNFDEYISHNKQPPRDYLMSYEQWYLSLGFSTGYRWATFLGNISLSGGMRVGLIKNIYDNELYRPFDPVLRVENNQWTMKNSIWLSLSLDQRDIFYDPSSGYYLYERMGLYGLFDIENEHYFRSDSKVEVFFTLFNLPVTENWNFKGVLGFHSGLSLIFTQPGRNLQIENGNKLAVDGMFIARGWRYEYPEKGLLLWDNWVELRFPIVYGILAFDLFFDVAGKETTEGYYFGKDSNGQPNFTIENLRFSFGGGFRFALPQLPLRLSLAKRFRIVDDKIEWQRGQLFADSRENSGVDLVFSFVLSY